MSPAGSTPSMEWLEAANRLETVAHQLSSVVHEVNNMLQIVSGSAEMLGMAADAPAAVVRRAEVIGAQVQRAAGLLMEVLAFSREVGDVERVDLRETVGRALSMRRYAMAKARIEERVELCAEDAVVCANPRRLLQIVLNLVMRGERVLGGHAHARLTAAVSSDGAQVRLAIEENSPGVPAELVGELAFEPPRQESASPAGLGIGMYVAAWLAQQDGGQLSVVPRSGGGSVATLSLPAA